MERVPPLRKKEKLFMERVPPLYNKNIYFYYILFFPYVNIFFLNNNYFFCPLISALSIGAVRLPSDNVIVSMGIPPCRKQFKMAGCHYNPRKLRHEL